MTNPLSPADLIQGTVRKPAPPLPTTAEPLVVRIYKALDDYVTPRRLGRLLTGIEIVLDRREGLILRPDITFVVDGRESIVSERVWGPPDMVLEITSQTTPSTKLLERVAWYSGYGVRECWLIQPEQRELAVLTLAHGGVRGRTLFGPQAPIRSQLMPDFDRVLGDLLMPIPG